MKNLLTILILTMMSITLAAQAVAVSNTGSIGATSTPSLTLPSFTVSANNNRLLIVCVTTISGALVTGVTFGGTPMIPIGTEERGGPRATLFYSILGSSVSLTSADIVATGGNLKQIGAVAFYNVQQSNPYDGFVTTEIQAVTGQTLPSTISLNVSSRSNDLVCDFFAGNANGATGITTDASQTEQVNNTSPGTTVHLGMSTEAGANPTVNMRWTINGTLTTGQAVLLGISVRSVNAPLPIELMSFDATTEGGGNYLTWATASEVNSYGFDIERSGDGVNFSRIGTVKAQGKAASYTYTDATPLNSMNYYRLKQMDNDQTSEYSKVISVQGTKGKSRIKIFPTYTEGVIQIMNDELGMMNVQVFNAMGQLVYANEATNRVDLSAMPLGMYFVQVQSGNEQVTEKVFKQ